MDETPHELSHYDRTTQRWVWSNRLVDAFSAEEIAKLQASLAQTRRITGGANAEPLWLSGGMIRNLSQISEVLVNRLGDGDDIVEYELLDA
eukprot:4917041-Amphidinium_carterae.1